MKKKKWAIIIPVIVGVLLIAGVLVWLLLPKKSEKEVLTGAIKQSLGITKIKEVVNNIDYKDLIENGTIHFSLDGSIKADGEKAKIKLDSYAENEKAYFSIDASSENELSAEALMKDGKLYFNVEDVTDKFYYMDLAEELDLDEFQEYAELIEKMDVNFEKVANALADSFFDEIDSEKIETENTTKTINGKEYDVKKYSYEFTGKDLYNALTKFVEKIKNDKDLKKEIEGLLETAEIQVELDEVFDELLNQLKSLEEIGKIFTYKAYVKGDDAISGEISITIPGQNIPISLVINSLDDYFEIYASVIGQKLLDFVVDKDKGVISLSVQGTEMIKGKIGDDFVEIQNTEEFPMNFTLRVTTKEKKDNSFKGNVIIEVDDFEADFDVVVEQTKEFPKVDVSDAESFDDMPEEVQEKFSEIFGTARPNYMDAFDMSDFSGLGDFS